MDNEKKCEIKINGNDVVVLNANVILVGRKTGNSIVVKNPETNINYLADEIKGAEIYNSNNQIHHNWLLIDLETGGRGWFPGSVTSGTLVRDDIVQIKEYSEETSKTLRVISNVDVKILDKLDDVTVYEWYHIKYEDVKGYIKAVHIESISYESSKEQI